MSLTAAQRSKIRRLSQPKELSPDEEGGELNIVPFLDIVMNILIFVLATVSMSFLSVLETVPPSRGGAGAVRQDQKKALNLTVLVVSEGFSVKTKAGHVAPGCEGAGSGDLTIPKKNGEYDYAALHSCAVKLKGLAPEFQAEQNVSLWPRSDTQFQVIVRSMDALRFGDKPGQLLFPKINFRISP